MISFHEKLFCNSNHFLYRTDTHNITKQSRAVIFRKNIISQHKPKKKITFAWKITTSKIQFLVE